MLNSLETKLVHHSLVYLFLYYFENIFTIKFLQGETKPIEWLKLKPKIKKINSHIAIRSVGIESLKVRYDITKSNLIIPLISVLCIDIDLSV